MTTLLLFSAWTGSIALASLFLLCFLAVHVAKLAKFGWLYRNQSDNEQNAQAKEQKTEQPQEKSTPAPSQEPIYYIVERKQKRAKPRYSEPKEIRFK